VNGRRDKVGLPTTIGKALEAKGSRTASRVFAAEGSVEEMFCIYGGGVVFPAISNDVNRVKCGLEVEAESKQDSAGEK
jgi:hypothetical protein